MRYNDSVNICDMWLIIIIFGFVFARPGFFSPLPFSFCLYLYECFFCCQSRAPAVEIVVEEVTLPVAWTGEPFPSDSYLVTLFQECEILIGRTNHFFPLITFFFLLIGPNYFFPSSLRIRWIEKLIFHGLRVLFFFFFFSVWPLVFIFFPWIRTETVNLNWDSEFELRHWLCLFLFLLFIWYFNRTRHTVVYMVLFSFSFQELREKKI